jgi:hypothetical protein
MVCCFAGRRRDIGSTFHFTCGLEVSSTALKTEARGGSMHVVLSTSTARGKGRAFFYIPTANTSGLICDINDKVCSQQVNPWKIVETDVHGGCVVQVTCALLVGKPMKISFIW